MAGIRVTADRRSRQPGTTIGVQVNTFGLKQLQGITGLDLVSLLLKAGQPALVQAQNEWPIDTGASQSTIELMAAEVGDKHARVVLQVGGEKLINHPLNKSHKDYAPMIELNGSPSGRGQGTILHAIVDNDAQIRGDMHEGVRNLLEQRVKNG